MSFFEANQCYPWRFSLPYLWSVIAWPAVLTFLRGIQSPFLHKFLSMTMWSTIMPYHIIPRITGKEAQENYLLTFGDYALLPALMLRNLEAPLMPGAVCTSRPTSCPWREECAAVMWASTMPGWLQEVSIHLEEFAATAEMPCVRFLRGSGRMSPDEFRWHAGYRPRVRPTIHKPGVRWALRLAGSIRSPLGRYGIVIFRVLLLLLLLDSISLFVPRSISSIFLLCLLSSLLSSSHLFLQLFPSFPLISYISIFRVS
jgi:hypothetical protein